MKGSQPGKQSLARAAGPAARKAAGASGPAAAASSAGSLAAAGPVLANDTKATMQQQDDIDVEKARVEAILHNYSPRTRAKAEALRVAIMNQKADDAADAEIQRSIKQKESKKKAALTPRANVEALVNTVGLKWKPRWQ